MNGLYDLNAENFENVALELFRHQAQHCPVYERFIHFLGIDPVQVKSLTQIPFLPISFFKTQEVVTGEWSPITVFESSGTTGTVSSKHYIKDTSFYLAHSQQLFEQFYGPLEAYHFLALLPSYLERGNSSLVYMVDHFIKESKSPYSGFYLDDLSALTKVLHEAYADQRRTTVLLGVSFALLDLVEEVQLAMPDLVVMETGGMKGRRKEMIREALHAQLTRGFGVEQIHSEYGMTELLSQAYSKGAGIFKAPPSMKVLFRDLNDPFSIDLNRSRGGVNIIDLANRHSCAFIETQDIGEAYGEDTFGIIGRFDNSDIRGCNLLLS